MVHDPSKYPKNWKTHIVPGIMKRAENKCEQCGAEPGKPHPETGKDVILTVAHLDQNTRNNDSSNLKYLCRVCHNRHDAKARGKSTSNYYKNNPKTKIKTSGKTWNSRIVKTEDVDPSKLLTNPNNWRIHPDEQKAVVNGSLETMGWIRNVLVNVNSGNIIDGHLRVILAKRSKQKTVPVDYVDLTEDEEIEALALLNTVDGMARKDAAKLDAIARKIQSQNEAIFNFLKTLEVEKKDVKVKKFEERPVNMAWVLIGTPIEEWIKIQPLIDKAEKIDGSIVETTVS